jgi:D-glycero-alpha-D-manno-heptose-7-phosphate kinase
MIISKCPLRVSLVGGSTDLEEFVQTYGMGSVISFPINWYTYITINKNITSDEYIINYSKNEQHSKPKDIQNDIAREVILEFNLPPVIMSFNSDIPSSGSGLASSSSYLIACISAAASFVDKHMSQTEMCRLALTIERRFNPLTGYQDPYGCGLGGLKKLDFHKSGRVVTEQLTSNVIKEHNMYLIPTKIERISTNILDTISIDKSLPLLTLVDKFYDNISSDSDFFDLFNQGWEVKKQTSKHITSQELLDREKKIREWYPNIKGLKLCGAGGGGYFLVFVPKDHPTIYSNAKNININYNGVQTWKI